MILSRPYATNPLEPTLNREVPELMSRRTPLNPDVVEFRVNKVFLDNLNAFYDRNKHKFVSGAGGARQHLFSEGLRRVLEDKTGTMITRALSDKKEFLDPRRKSVQIRVDNLSMNAINDRLPDATKAQTKEDGVPAVLKIGYDAQL